MPFTLVKRLRHTIGLLAFILGGAGLGGSVAWSTSKDVAKTILFLGDSITEGYNLPKEAAYPAVVGQTLANNGYKNIRIINAGVSGSTTASAPPRLRWHLRSKDKADILFLALGANDGLRGLDTKAMKKNLVETIAIAKKEKMTVMLAGMKMPPNYGKDYADRFEKTFAEIATEENVTLIPFLLEGVGGEPKFNLPDGIHPNVEGAKIIAKTVYKFLEPLL